MVDDDSSVRRATQRLLTVEGFAVETFASAEQFLESAEVGCSACLVVDVEMPGLNGLELQELLASGMIATPIVI